MSIGTFEFAFRFTFRVREHRLVRVIGIGLARYPFLIDQSILSMQEIIRNVLELYILHTDMVYILRYEI
jgi:hypothetical protein